MLMGHALFNHFCCHHICIQPPNSKRLKVLRVNVASKEIELEPPVVGIGGAALKGLDGCIERGSHGE